MVIGPAAAGADGPTGDVVGHGVSREGQRWTQSAGLDLGSLDVEVSLPDARGIDDGGGSQGTVSVKVPTIVSQGSGFGRHRREYEVDGYAYKSVTALRVSTTAGTRSFHPYRAPAEVAQRTPELLNVRFFVVFFESKPLSLTALNAKGHIVQHITLGHRER